MDERLREMLRWAAPAALVTVTVYAVALVVLPMIASALTAFFLSPGVLILLWLVWFRTRTRGK